MQCMVYKPPQNTKTHCVVVVRLLPSCLHGAWCMVQIVEGASSIDDENREEVDEDETTAATASSFTNRETPMRWKPHDIIKFYRVSDE